MTTLDPIVQSLLDAPVGQVKDTLEEILKCPVYLDIIEQNSTSGTKFSRKITITANELPIIRAVVTFDSSVLPPPILSQLLRKKDGIGTILTKNKIKADRKITSLSQDNNGKTVKRSYEIINNGSSWFEISEEIRLDYLSSCKNSC
ncbi:MAG: hypothetical protein O6761_03055 [Thaumarchaeota archaeon]|nr:hypothetical protein [Nitrososphaerota archaeon]GFN39286.1 MAG: conserved hypothetical protein [Marine Group I thaumarchaeote]